jgi:hypothetical protein
VALGVDFSAAATGDDALTPEEVCEIVGETTSRAFDAAKAILRSQAAAVLAAFSAVCRDGMGLEPECVLHAHLGPLVVEQLGLDELDGAKPDGEALAAWRLAPRLTRGWRQDRPGGRTHPRLLSAPYSVGEGRRHDSPRPRPLRRSGRARGRGRSAETARKLLDDAGADRVGHHQDVPVDAVVVADVRQEVAAQPVRGLVQRLI